MQITIEALSRKQRVSNKTGKPFTSLGLKTKEHGAKWLSGFDNATTKDWKVGDTVEIEIEQKGEYLNFTTARKDSTPQSESSARNYLEFRIEPQLAAIYGRLGLIGAKLDIKMDGGYPPMTKANDASGFDEPAIEIGTDSSPF